MIDLLQPDLLVKGADYEKDQVVGARNVESWGGKVLLAKLEADNSTSQTIQRMRGKGRKKGEGSS